MERKFLEMISVITERDFINYDFIIQVDEKKNRKEYYLKRECEDSKRVNINAMYSQVRKILKAEDMSSIKLSEFITAGRKNTVKNIKKSFSTEAFTLTKLMKEEFSKEMDKTLASFSEKIKLAKDVETLDIANVYNNINEYKLTKEELKLLTKAFPFLSVLKTVTLDKILKDTELLELRKSCEHSKAKYEIKKSQGQQVSVICPDCKYSMTLNNSKEVLIDNLDISYQYQMIKALNLLKGINIKTIVGITAFVDSLSRKHKKSLGATEKTYIDIFGRYSNFPHVFALLDSDNGLKLKESSFNFLENSFLFEDWENKTDEIKIKIKSIVDEDIVRVELKIKNHHLRLIEILEKDEMVIIFSAIKKHKNYGRGTYARLLKGSKDKRIKEYGLDKSEFYGKIPKLKIPEIEMLIYELERIEILETSYEGTFKLPILRITKQGELVYQKVKSKEGQERVSKEKDKFDKLPIKKAFTSLSTAELGRFISTFDKDRLEDEACLLDLLFCFAEYRKKYLSSIEKMITLMAKIPSKYIPILELSYEMSEGVNRTTLREVIKRIEREEE